MTDTAAATWNSHPEKAPVVFLLDKSINQRNQRDSRKTAGTTTTAMTTKKKWTCIPMYSCTSR